MFRKLADSGRKRKKAKSVKLPHPSAMDGRKNKNHEKMWNRVKYISKDIEKRVQIEKDECMAGSILPQTGL